MFSPSIDVDSTWIPVKYYISKEMKITHDKDKEPIYFDHYDAVALSNVSSMQHKIIEYMKEQKGKNIILCSSRD